MQVSWIDADEVRDLVALLAEPPARSRPGTPDLDTLPEMGDRYGFEFLTEKLASAAWQPSIETPAEIPPAEEVPIQPDVSQIREKLRAIRDRAREAGLLTKETSAERAALNPPPSPPPALFQHAPSAPPHRFTPPSPPQATVSASEPAPAHAPVSPPMEVPPSPSPAHPPVATLDSSGTTPQEDTIAERLDVFAQVSAKLTTSEEMFMLDDHGDLLWGTPTSDDLLICAKLAMNASMRSHAATLAPPASSTPVQVGPGKELQLITCPTDQGDVAVVLVNARQVPVAMLREALALAMGR